MTRYELLCHELAQHVINTAGDEANNEDHFSIIGAVAQELIQYLVDTVEPA